jgi:hypothetical protein
MVPIGIVVLFLVAEYFYFINLRDNIFPNWENHKSDVISLMSKYPGKFNPSEVNQSSYEVVTSNMATKSIKIVDSIAWDLLISLAIVSVLSMIIAARNAKVLPSQYNRPLGYLQKQSHWLSSGGTISSSISATVGASITLVGAISLLSPNIVGGYIIAGLEILLVCVILGILIQMVGSGIVKGNGHTDNEIVIDSKGGAQWEGLIAIQFLMLPIGIGLIIAQVIFR